MKQKIYASNSKDITKLELDNRELSYQAAKEAIVLLKNDGVLPLTTNKVALFGSGAKKTIKGGTGSGEVNERYSVSIYSGLLNKGFQITSEKWLDDYDEEYNNHLAVYLKMRINLFTLFNDFAEGFSYPFGRMIEEDDIDKDTKVAIYVASRQAGEGGDKKLDNGDYNLVEVEVANLKFLKEHYQKVILIINSGSSMDLSNIDSLNIDGIVYVAGLGEEGGNAIADLLKGSFSPSGRLSDTWANKYMDIPYGNEYSYLNGDTSKDYYREDIYVGYRYFDTFKKDVRYPFGYGLSYSKFSYQYTNYKYDNEMVSFDCTIKNIGEYKSKDVLEVFIAMPNGKLKKERRRLISFKKTKELEVGEIENIHIGFNLKDASSFSTNDASYLLEKGLYLVYAGANINDCEAIFGIDLDRDYYPYKLANLVKCDDFEKLEPDFENEYIIPANLEIIKASGIKEAIISYENSDLKVSDRAKSILDSLSLKEKIDLCVGLGFRGMIDSKGIYTPGTVGKTTTKLSEKGIVNVNLCDGPAGLRILKESALNKKGKLKMVSDNYPLGLMARLPKWMIKSLLAKDNDTRLYQYATAFPVGTALAQTYNTDLCLEIGKAISKEMSIYGVTYFLGPALNIHKNPLCGRNFEYYSEDPLLSGMIASSINKGVNSISGNYATIKHFACNNLEDNRQHSTSYVSERALREIYLKGFEICVKSSEVYALMSSYNLVNGLYAGNRYDLNTGILRKEWGFKGLVMTDWYETGKGRASEAIAIASGVDLIMPGTKNAKKDIKRGLKKGLVSIDDLNRACLIIIEQIINSKVSKSYLGENDD